MCRVLHFFRRFCKRRSEPSDDDQIKTHNLPVILRRIEIISQAITTSTITSDTQSSAYSISIIPPPRRALKLRTRSCAPSSSTAAAICQIERTRCRGPSQLGYSLSLSPPTLRAIGEKSDETSTGTVNQTKSHHHPADPLSAPPPPFDS